MPWTVRLSAAADADFQQIVRWTEAHFGARQAFTYAGIVTETIAALMHGPNAPGGRVRADLGVRLHTLHVSSGKRRGRHFVLFRPRADESDRIIEVVRILHDAMDLASHVPPDDPL